MKPSLDDRTLQFPHAEVERVPVPMLLVYAAGLPVAFILLATLVVPGRSSKEKQHQFHVGLLGLAISLAITAFITDTIKNGYGRPRPDLIARCKPQSVTPQDKLVGMEVCTEPDHHTLYDGFRSFPSGHSSFSWGGLGYLSLYVAPSAREVYQQIDVLKPCRFFSGQLRALRPGSDMTRVVVSGIPALGALLITLSRTEDYRHDIYDVTVGSLVGVLIAYYSYVRDFPPLRLTIPSS
jgi:diacylglycerol diphosphate phosphatase/phosphatidate phosphatase